MRESEHRAILNESPEPLDGLEDEALAALWRVGARKRWSAVTAEYAGPGTNDWEVRQYRVLWHLMRRGLVAREHRKGDETPSLWWLTEEGWEAAEALAVEAGYGLWSPADAGAKMPSR